MGVQSGLKPVSRFDRVMGRMSRVMAIGAAVTLAAMMMITVADVLGRNVFRLTGLIGLKPWLGPLKGTFELVGILLVIVASGGMGYCQFLKGHIRIDVIYNRLSTRGRAVLDTVAYIMGIAAVGMISWQTLLRMNEYIHRELGGVTEILGMPLWPFMLMLAIGFGWLGVLLLIDLYRALVEVFRR